MPQHLLAVASPKYPDRLSRALLAANIVVATLLGAALWLALHTSHEAFSRQARTVTEDLSASMGASIANELKLVDNALLSVRAEVSAAGGLRRMGSAGAQHALDRQHALVPWVPALRIADAAGMVRTGRGVTGVRPLNVSDRPYFVQARDQAADAPVLSEPLQSRNEGRWGIAFARALYRADGQFDGVVYAAVPVEHFERLLARVDLGAQGAATLRTTSLRLVARVADGRPATVKVGSNTVSLQLTQALERSPQRGFFISRTALDGIERSNAYQQIDPYSLVLLTGLSTDAFFAPWRRHALQLVMLAVVIMVVLGGSSVLLLRSRTKERMALARIGDLAREQNAMLDNELIGIVKARDRKTVWMNKAMERIFGYRPDELIGASARLLHPDDMSYESLASAYPAMAGGRHFRTQLQMRRKDGELVWIDLTGKMLSGTDTLWMMADVTAQKLSEEQIRHAALHDALTGLPNRALLAQRFDSALHAAEEQGHIAAVAIFDLDGFKQVNDRHGHGAGDAVLTEVAKRLQLCVRGHDTVARWGGDEFVVVLTGASDKENTLATVRRLLEDLMRPIDIGDGAVASIGASIGLAFYRADGSDTEALLDVADQRMFRAKRAGRNRIVFETSPDERPALQVVGKT